MRCALTPRSPSSHCARPQIGESFCFPSEKLLESMPDDKKTVQERRDWIKVWVKEFVAVQKNPGGYYKLTNKDWDFDILNDMLFSFWVLAPIPATHKKAR